MEIHACTLHFSRAFFYCKSCKFTGSLSDSIEHIVKNQFEVKPPPPKKPSLTDYIYADIETKRERRTTNKKRTWKSDDYN